MTPRSLRYLVLVPLSVGRLVVAWLVVMQVLRKRWRDTVEAECDRQIGPRASGWARAGLSIFALALAVMFVFSPLGHPGWARPLAISSLLMAGLTGSCLLGYAVTGITCWHDRRGA
ncbi:hypothetical protein [Rhodanobacter spathiphylli]|uniref:hypothetical protein n=1 Tax=Rhodanobacter spathiphylli TaxID=347483 RepID=UPI0012F7BAA8|nr:hypothetical protein [Rhodanobacter spathiphylli]